MKRLSEKDKYFLDMAEFVSTKSKDSSTKVGCVIIGPDDEVRSTGYNDFPRGIEDDPAKVPGRWNNRPEKYSWVEHAERNAVYNAARVGTALKGCTAYLNWEPKPCEDCMRALIQVGIVEIVGPNKPFAGVGNGEFYDTDSITVVMSEESGIILRVVDYDPAQHTKRD